MLESIMPMSDLENRIRASDRPVADLAGAVAGKAAVAAEEVSKQVDQTMQKAGAAVSAATQKGEDAADRAGEVVANIRDAIVASARAQPTTTVLMAVAAGFLLGAIWKSGK
jgi:hypothetical protein